MRRVRQIHVWLGVFFAPAILFFAVSGAVMTLGLHKNRTGSDAIPLLARMAEIHRKQNAFPQPAATTKTTNERVQGDKGTAEKPASESRAKLLFRAFVVVMAAGLVVTTLLGLVMAFMQRRGRPGMVAAFLLGLVLPVVLLLV